METDKIAILVKSLALEFDKFANPILLTYNLTPTQYKVLKYLYNNDNVIGLDIQNAFSMTNPSVTGILQNMENGGWITRNTNPNDSRSKIIILTDKALKLKEELYVIGEDLENAFTESLSKEEYERLKKLLNKLLYNIKNLGGNNE